MGGGTDTTKAAARRDRFMDASRKYSSTWYTFAQVNIRVAIFTAPHLSGSGRVDMLACQVAAARAAVATGASGEIDTRHVSDTWKCESSKLYLTHPLEE